MQANGTILINVNIDNRPLRLRVTLKDEEGVRLSAQVLNQRINAFKSFDTQDPLDRISWAALDLAGEIIRLKQDHGGIEHAVEEEIAAIESLLYT